MIDGKYYIDTVKKYYSFLITEFKMSIIDEKIRGNAFYDLQYGDITKAVSINYENIEDYFQVIVFMLHNGKMPNYDDKTKTLHLNKLNGIVLSKADKSEILTNNGYFSKFQPKDELEKKLLKSAKELRLCLLYFDKIEVV